MQSVSKHIACCCQFVIQAYGFKLEMFLFSKKSGSVIFAIEEFGIRLPECMHEPIRIACLYHQVCMVEHEGLNKTIGVRLVESKSKAVEPSVEIFLVTEHDLVACRQAKMISLFHNIYLLHKSSSRISRTSPSKCMMLKQIYEKLRQLSFAFINKKSDVPRISFFLVHHPRFCS